MAWAAQAAGAAPVKPYPKQSEMLSSAPDRVGQEDKVGLMVVPRDALSVGRRWWSEITSRKVLHLGWG